MIGAVLAILIISDVLARQSSVALRYFGDAGLGAAFTITVPFIQAWSVQ